MLVDVSPYSFGPSYMAEKDGFPYPHCYHPIIRRNTPLPVTRTDRYCTGHPRQTEVDVRIYQGDDPDALKNILVGDFRVEGLTATDTMNEVLCRMTLDVDGILHVTAIEKSTGLSKHITIANALTQKSEAEIEAARVRLAELYGRRDESGGEPFAESVDGGSDDEDEDEDEDEGLEEAGEQAETAGGESGSLVTPRAAEDAPEDASWDRLVQSSRALMERSRNLLGTLHDEDKEEAIGLHEEIETAIAHRDVDRLGAAKHDLEELLFFVEGK
ncbi:MAG: Hsp70 family protein [Candidatus Riflebacteria bacterium]|nr:Hsp70 family protein [Candidatus Riflebacteria bacterium]